jgi:hypothetical protein
MNEVVHEQTESALFRSQLPIDAKLDKARVHLLDLTARNRLLNVPRSQSRSGNLIEVVDEKALEVFKLLVRESKALTFAPGRSANGETETEFDEVEALAQPGDDGVDARGVANRHTDTRLQTRLTSKGLQKRLLNLYFDARTLEEEQGVNVLYLALGTLKWIDPKNAANIRYAPLILVPVSLERATAGDRFKLRWRQEDPSSNLSLEAMLERDHTLKLPAFEASDEFDLGAYFDGVRHAVASKSSWEVAPDDILLGFFSFSKFLMYRDLSVDTWPTNASLSAQPLIRALLRDGFPARPVHIDDDANIDSALPPSKLLHIVDADSSQTLAVEDARQGHNLVIQGPPGTGKSQTIANIIAAAVADNKTVLFVAEKMAALDVVKRRLDALDVGAACLELHSNKANKRAVLDELKRTWELSSPRGSSFSHLQQRLTASRDGLNAHVERLHREHAQSGLSAYQVLGELVRLQAQGTPPNDLSLPEATQWSFEGVRERRALLDELAERIEVMGEPQTHPWRGVGLEVVLPNQLVRLLEKVQSAAAALAARRQAHADIANVLHIPAPKTLAEASALYRIAERVASAPSIDNAALAHPWWSERRSDIGHALAIGEQWQKAWDALHPAMQPNALDVAVDEALATLSTLPPTLEAAAFTRARSVSELLPSLVIELGRLKTVLGQDEPADTLAAASKAALTGQRVAAAPEASPEVFAAAVWDSGVEQAGELAEAVARIEDARAKVGEKVTAPAWETDTERERQIVRLKGSSWFRFFSGDWRRANALLRSLLRDPKQPVEAVLELLDTVADSQLAMRNVRQNDALGRAAFGADWNGEKSHATPLRALVAWMKSLRGLGAAPRLIAARLPNRSDIGARASRVHQLVNQVRPLLEAMWTDLGNTVQQGFNDAASVSSARLSLLLARASAMAKAEVVCAQSLALLEQPAGERLSLLERLKGAQDLRAKVAQQRELGEAVFGAHWQGPGSEWSELAAITGWVQQHEDVRTIAGSLSDRSAPWASSQRSATADAAWREQFETLLGEVRSDRATLFGVDEAEALPFDAVESRLASWLEHGEALSTWTAYRERAEQARRLGLGDVVERVQSRRLPPEDAADAFDMAYHEALLNDLVAQDSELGRFDGELHQRLVHEFAQLDRESLHANRVQVVQTHHRRLPARDGGVGPVGVLRSEMAKRRGHLPIRKLMTEAAPAIQALKPVFMMSPLSIAQFLPPGKLTFDVLVMDEASQIQPVDALGAVARCRQVVVVGDERQLPPTTFFSKITEGAEDDEDATAPVSDIESILGLFKARGLSQRMLRWHYRSRHQSLIAVSNSQFYENKLYIVPSPHTSEAGMGLRFHHLPDGVFDSGGTGANQVEAEAVAKAILDHIQRHPKQSLGVATFSIRQRRAILDQVEHLRREHPETEAFFHAHPNEPFFVKNLENVQGDERDVMFISVGYGRNKQGVLAMRFGPLGNQGGERRLNVLISRAKLRCEVFSSITDDDIDTERARGVGVLAFKLFLRFARTGRLDTAGADRTGQADVFEAQVAQALHEKGYVVHPRVGIAGLFIDLAIADPDSPGRYILGIECDGRSYREARSARDRDRLQRSVLEDHGWILHRIWSLDWFRRPQAELAKLLAAVEAAKRALSEGAQALVRLSATVEVKTIERDDVIEVGLDIATERSGAPLYGQASIKALRGYPDIHTVPVPALATLVESVVSVEGPVHADIVVQRIRDAWGVQRAGSRIQDAVASAIQHAKRAKAIHRSGDFLSKPDAESVARDRSQADSAVRRPEMIAPEEWRAAIVAVVQRNLGVKRNELPMAAGRWLGFASTSAAVREQVAAQASEAQRRGRLRLDGETWVSL